MPTTKPLSDNLVVKSNELIMASYAMTVNEQRLLLACIGQIDSRQTLETEAVFTLSVEQARDLFYSKGDQRNAYRDLQEAAERLFERKVRIDLGGQKELLTRFVQSVRFDHDRGSVQVRFAHEILPYLSQLERNFTKYRLSNIVQLTSSHAVRIYELIVSWGTQGQWYKEMEIDEFRELLGLGEKYKQNGELRRFVTDKAIEQINENTDFELDISFRKSKRAFKWIQLRFNRKEDAAKAEAAAKAEREKQRLHNEAAKAARLSHEAKQAAKSAQEAAEGDFDAYPEGTLFLALDGTLWRKEAGFLIHTEKNLSMPPFQAAKAVAAGHFSPQGVSMPES